MQKRSIVNRVLDDWNDRNQGDIHVLNIPSLAREIVETLAIEFPETKIEKILPELKELKRLRADEIERMRHFMGKAELLGIATAKDKIIGWAILFGMIIGTVIAVFYFMRYLMPCVG